MSAVQDSNDRGTIDQQQKPQQNIDESKQIVKASDSLATQQERLQKQRLSKYQSVMKNYMSMARS
jgi:hypothetical protein